MVLESFLTLHPASHFAPARPWSSMAGRRASDAIRAMWRARSGSFCAAVSAAVRREQPTEGMRVEGGVQRCAIHNLNRLTLALDAERSAAWHAMYQQLRRWPEVECLELPVQKPALILARVGGQKRPAGGSIDLVWTEKTQLGEVLKKVLRCSSSARFQPLGPPSRS